MLSLEVDGSFSHGPLRSPRIVDTITPGATALKRGVKAAQRSIEQYLGTKTWETESVDSTCSIYGATGFKFHVQLLRYRERCE